MFCFVQKDGNGSSDTVNASNSCQQKDTFIT